MRERSAFGVRRSAVGTRSRAIRRRTSMKLRIQGVKNSRIQEVDRLAALLFDNIFIGRATKDRAAFPPNAERRTPNAER